MKTTSSPFFGDINLAAIPEKPEDILAKLRLGMRFSAAEVPLDAEAIIEALAEAIAGGHIAPPAHLAAAMSVPVCPAQMEGMLRQYFGDDMENAESDLKENIKRDLFMPFMDYRLFDNVMSDESLRLCMATEMLSYRHGKTKRISVIKRMVGEMIDLDLEIGDSAICLAEIALVNHDWLSRMSGVGTASGEQIRDVLENMKPDDRGRVRAIRSALSEEDDVIAQLDEDYMARCDAVAARVYGPTYRRDIVPFFQAISRLLRATDYFGYRDSGYTQHIRSDRVDEYIHDVAADAVREDRKASRQPFLHEYSVNLDESLVRSTLAMLMEGNKVVKQESDLAHRCGFSPFSPSVLAEVVSGALLGILDQPEESGHNCQPRDAQNDKKQEFLTHAPGNEPDAYALHEKFVLTIEVSTASGQKSPIGKIGKENAEYTLNREFKNAIVYDDNMTTGVRHIADYANSKGMANCPQFAIMLNRTIPKNAGSMRNVLSLAADEARPTVIPMTFGMMTTKMEKLSIDSRAIASDDLLAFFQSVEKSLVVLHEIFNDTGETSALIRERFDADDDTVKALSDALEQANTETLMTKLVVRHAPLLEKKKSLISVKAAQAPGPEQTQDNNGLK